LTHSSSLSNLFRIVRAFFALTSAAALALYVYLGALIRPIGDDYCISARLMMGYDLLTTSLIKYWYTSNRFSNQFVAWFSDLFGPRGVAVLAVVSLLLWLAGLTWLLYESARLLRLRWDFWAGLLFAELIVLVSYYTSPNLFQSVQWRPGLMTYLLPLVIYSFLFAGILRGARTAAGRVAQRIETSDSKPRRPSTLRLDFGLLGTIVLLFFVAFFAGGLSETAGALHISVLGLALAANFLWNKTPTRRAALVLITAALAGALLAMVGMFITPANAIRLNGVAPLPWTTVIWNALTYGAQFLSEAARLLKQPAAFAFGSAALVTYLFAKSSDKELPAARKLWIGLVVVPVLTYLLTIATFAPSAYGQSYPVERVRFPAHALLTAALLLEGGLLGLLAARIRLPRWTLALAVLALVVASIYPLWITRNNLALVPEYRTRAVQWDQRDARIRELAASGKKDIAVWQLPGIANVKDLDRRRVHWINYCAAIYYGVDTIAAPQREIPSP